MEKRNNAFTLIELLVVVAIIALLMGILMPVLRKARDAGRQTVCLSNVRSLTIAWSMYSDENDNRLINANAVRIQQSAPGKDVWASGRPTWASTLNSRFKRSTMICRCSSPIQEMMVSFVSSS